MDEKVIFLNKSDFTEEQWDILCDAFAANSEKTSISCLIDVSSVSQRD